MFVRKKILIIADFDPARMCGATIHLNYIKKYLNKNNVVELQNNATLCQIAKSDIIWFRSEKNFFKFFLFCLICKKKMIYDMSSLPWCELKIERRSSLRISLSLYIFKLATKVSQIRVLSRAMRDHFVQNFHLPLGKIIVLPIPIDVNIKSVKNRTNGRIHFIYTGSNRIWQGLPNLIQAFNKIESESEFVLECYGINDTDTKNIHFFGSVSHEDLMDIISSRIDVVVVPRERNEITEIVMPIKYAEAIHLGKYVLATDLKVLHEIASNRVVFLKDNEVNTLIRGIKSFRNVISSSQ